MGGSISGSVVDSILWPPVAYRRYYTLDGRIRDIVMLDIDEERKIATRFISGSNDAKYVILFSHGNAEDISMSYHWMNILAKKLGVDLLLWDPEGYGASTGEPSIKALEQGVATVLAHLKTIIRPDQRIVAMGRSIGSYPASFVAKSPDVCGLILECPLASAYRVAFGSTGSVLPFDRYRVIDNVRTLEKPVLLIHGTDDEIVPFCNSSPMLENSIKRGYKVPPLYLEGGGHNDLESKFPNELLHRMRVFFETELVPEMAN
ncbi:Alpha/beta hydrolase family [Carpediemonas membranifera]|uniref:Alpha/beta hydrolase family n=1 Tax=Carpediemonas membranifera TaxID=201153 RepID=A0A8J6B978_9EUKA|nr:Alpha/beta hydrolase family [Carpediemonas membranifera]|eukprot:KAG9395804.1 Alpha/beta hydrolase family [Carpediemonas membranifera]